MNLTVGNIVHSFFEDYLKMQKGLRISSIRSYRDTLRIFLEFTARKKKKHIVKITWKDFSADLVFSFLNYLENERNNQVRSRNQRLAVLHTFFEYAAGRIPELLEIGQQIALIPVKRSPPPETHYLTQEEIRTFFHKLPRKGRFALRDRTLFLFLYNTGARVQEVADLNIENLELDPPARVHLHGKGDKWRVCPLWEETVKHLRELLTAHTEKFRGKNCPVFCARPGIALTRFGIYKIVRRYASFLDTSGAHPRHVTPHLFRHTAAMHLLEAGVEVNVIRGWLGHVSLDTTNRYAELTLNSKEAALRECESLLNTSKGSLHKPVWRNDKSILNWLESL